MEENKFRTIINFHLIHYTSPDKDRKPEHIIISAMLLEGKIASYKAYVDACTRVDIAGVSQKTWDEEAK